jgi:hypothetical protein
MHTVELDSVITEDEVSEIERISQENTRQISLNRRIALTILAYDRERLHKSIAEDPVTYRHLIRSLEECMESLKSQIRILETAGTRLSAHLSDAPGSQDTMH